MCLLIESIYVKDGKFRNVSYHEKRLNETRQTLFSINQKLCLHAILSTVQFPLTGLFKCRIIYDKEIRSIEFQPYVSRPISTLKLIVDNEMDYRFKFLDRTRIDGLYNRRDTCDDILIVKNGWITDTSYANIVFKNDSGYFTPETCLLKGTMRSCLIDTGTIRPIRIKINEIENFSSFRLINAMLGFDSPTISVKNIFR
jgi:4-amino-4-deoxychorismate lyase